MGEHQAPGLGGVSCQSPALSADLQGAWEAAPTWLGFQGSRWAGPFPAAASEDVRGWIPKPKGQLR